MYNLHTPGTNLHTIWARTGNLHACCIFPEKSKSFPPLRSTIMHKHVQVRAQSASAKIGGKFAAIMDLALRSYLLWGGLEKQASSPVPLWHGKQARRKPFHSGISLFSSLFFVPPDKAVGVFFFLRLRQKDCGNNSYETRANQMRYTGVEFLDPAVVQPISDNFLMYSYVAAIWTCR